MGWAGEALPDAAVDALHVLAAALRGPLAAELAEHVTRAEVRAVVSRTAALLSAPVYPSPDVEGRPIPWPAF